MDLIRAVIFIVLGLSILSNSKAGIKIALKDQLFQELGSIGLPNLFNSLNKSLAVPHSMIKKILVLNIKFLE